MKALILFVTLSVLTFWVFADQFKYLQPKDGLSSGEINQIIEDYQGRIWIATWTGLICYDGSSFRNYRPVLGDPFSMPDKKVKKLLVDTNGNLWIATEKHLVRMKHKDFKFETFLFKGKSSDPINILNLVQVGDYLIIHTTKGFYRVHIDQSPKNFSINHIMVYSENNEMFDYYHNSFSYSDVLYCVANDEKGSYASVFSMFYHYDGKDTVLKIESTFPIEGNVNHIGMSYQSDYLLFATNRGVLQFNVSSQKFNSGYLFPQKNIRMCLGACNDMVYAVGSEPGLYFHHLKTNEEGRYSANPSKTGTILNSRILCLFQDFSGSLWVGHQGQGISMLNLRQKAFYTIRHDPFLPNSLNSNAVMCVNGNGHELLVGCRSGGINIANMNEITSQKVVFNEVGAGLISGVWDIAKQNDSLFWIGHGDGLCKLTKRAGRWEIEKFGKGEPINTTIRKIVIDDDNNLWCGSMKSGLIFIPDPSENPDQLVYNYTFNANDSLSISDNVVLDIFFDSRKQLLVATGNGFNLVSGRAASINSISEKPNLIFKRYLGGVANGKNLNNNEVNCIVEIDNYKYWIATQGGGINIFDPDDDSFSYLTVENGLPGNDVFGILTDNEQNIWISTEKGLAKYHQGDITVYTGSDGIQSDVFLINSAYKSVNGMLFFGGENGLSAFYPNQIVSNCTAPKTLFTDILIAGNKFSVGDSFDGCCLLESHLNETKRIELPYRVNSFAIGVTAIHYQFPEGNQIEYMLENYHNQWYSVPSSQQYLFFNKIPPGKYILKASAISSDNVSASEIKQLEIIILKPWYRSTHMIVVYLVLGITIITLSVLSFFNRQKQRYLKRICDLNIENNESKMTFLENIAHELKTPVSLIVSPIEDMIINKNDLGTKWHNHIYLMHRNAQYVLKLINQIIDFRKLESGKLQLNLHNDDVVRLINDVSINFNAFELSKNVELKIQSSHKELLAQIDTQKIEEVLYNILSNAFKNTPDGQQIEISMNIVQNGVLSFGDASKQFIEISILNEGSSIEPGDEERIFERFYHSDKNIDGAGIGLSFAKSLVELHNGKIWAENILNKGVAFHLLLPYLVADTLSEDVKDNALFDEKVLDKRDEFLKYYNSGIESNLIDNKIKILIVEDNKDLREYLVELLSRNYKCFQAQNGIEGIKIVNQVNPDIIITDIMMPKLDGYGFVQKIKEDIKTCHIPVIMLTAKSTNESIVAGYKSGVDAYITKPFDTSVVLSQISRLVLNRKLIHEKYKQQNFMVEVSAQNLSREDVFLKKVKKILDKNIENADFNVKELSVEMNMSTTQLYRKIKSLTNYSPVEFLRITRLHKAHDLLIQRSYSIKEVSYLTGFNNLSYFVKCFREYFDVTPASFRDKMWPIE